jgi:hypothetical protein
MRRSEREPGKKPEQAQTRQARFGIGAFAHESLFLLLN